MSIEEQLDQAAGLLAESNRLAVLTGAGISTRSGIPDFRSASSGMWKNVDPYKVASLDGFRRQPQAFFDWLRPLAEIVFDAEPNAAHLALVKMENDGPLEGIITQNIDMLHFKAGSKNIFELHGHWREATCIRCCTVYPSDSHLSEFLESGLIPRCERCEGVLKPNVILYGEQLPINILNGAQLLARTCDLMIIAGSSLKVTPACDIPMLAIENEARSIIINLEPTYLDEYADIVFREDVVDVLPVLADNVSRL